jgi:tetratricopeptide (TPR) repeat protein/predicted Ser/Thr protein kinase
MFAVSVSSEPTLGGDLTSQNLEQTESTLPRAASDEARRGALIDRYVVIDLAGAGAMGVVLAAYDPELDRKVAVKLLKFADETARTRLQREAQALAKLQHHNVVTVYDVGTHDGQLFMAMEFVEGKTLGRWMAELGHPQPWREVVRVFGEAGEGLAAAHEAGLVHRDFKPENVMMSADGRVRVMDFGLARTSNFDAAELTAEPASSSLSSSTSALTRTLTQTGALMGTPAYMSVEQFEGKPATALSDQFSFCVALYQGLYGERPFSGATLGMLFEGIGQGRIKAAPRGSAVPPWLRKVVVRGLAAVPEQRWPSMRALLDALADDPADRRRRWLAVTLTVGLIGVAVWGVTHAIGATSVCRGADRKLQGVWDDDRRAAVETAMLATNLSYAPGTWERVELRLDGYAEAWAAARTEACEATQRGEQSEQLLDLRMACLDRHLTYLHATVEQLGQADVTTVESAVAAVARLPQISECANVEALTEESTSPTPEVAALEQRLIAAEALENLGKIEDALKLVETVVQEANNLEDPRVRVHASQALGRLQQFAGNYEAAATTLEQTYRAAIMTGMLDEAATAARRLIVVLGGARGLARPRDGRAWALHAEVLTKAAGSEEDYAQYEIDIGELDTMDGEYASARTHYERALAIYEGLPNGQYGVIGATTRLANAEIYVGDLAAARRHYERSLAILEQTFDPTHPDIGRMHLSLGDTALQEKRYPEARDSLQAALTIFEQALGPGHPLVGYTMGSLGYVESWEENHGVARKHLERAIALLEASVGVDHYYYVEAQSKMGSVLHLAGDYADAKEHYERARAGMERTMGPDHPSVGYVLLNLAEVAVAQKEYELARTHAEAALAILQPKLAADHPDIELLREILADALRGLESSL